MDLQIRTAEPEDLPGLLALYQLLIPGDEQPSIVAAEAALAQLGQIPNSGVILGIADHQLVSSCTLVVVPNLTRGGKPYALIENVVTDGLYRARGFGRRVLAAAVSAAWDADCYKVMLMTGSKDPATHRFYEGAGFEKSKTGFQIRRITARDT